MPIAIRMSKDLMPKNLAIDLLRIDGGTQSRVAINEDVVTDYTSIISEVGSGWPFPPIHVFHDGTDYFVADGFHRVLAGQRAKRGLIPCEIHKGTAEDAHIFGMTANDRHGLRMSREDKRACVEWLLDQPGRMSQKEIAEKAGVSRTTVQTIVADRNPASVNKQKTGDIPQTPSNGPKKLNLSFDPPEEEEIEDQPDISTDDLAKKNKKLAHAYRDKLVRAIGDYHDVVPNRAEYLRLKAIVQGVNLW